MINHLDIGAVQSRENGTVGVNTSWIDIGAVQRGTGGGGGGNVKSASGVLFANIKSISGITKANIKKISGVTVRVFTTLQKGLTRLRGVLKYRYVSEDYHVH